MQGKQSFLSSNALNFKLLKNQKFLKRKKLVPSRRMNDEWWINRCDKHGEIVFLFKISLKFALKHLFSIYERLEQLLKIEEYNLNNPFMNDFLTMV